MIELDDGGPTAAETMAALTREVLSLRGEKHKLREALRHLTDAASDTIERWPHPQVLVRAEREAREVLGAQGRD
jgi:hypothetical protein